MPKRNCGQLLVDTHKSINQIENVTENFIVFAKCGELSFEVNSQGIVRECVSKIQIIFKEYKKDIYSSWSREKVKYYLNIGKQQYLHRVVAEHFIKNPYKYKYVSPRDGNYLNCDVTNLEWVKKL